MTKTMHFDGPCPLLTCQETGPHDHEVCPECGSVRHGNITCNTCRRWMNAKFGWDLPMSNNPPVKPCGAADIEPFLRRLEANP